MSDAKDEHEKIVGAILEGSPFGLQDNALVMLNHFVSEYLHWGRSIHLVSRRDPGSSLATQIVESLFMLDFAGNLLSGRGGGPFQVADVGSGYGFPGLVWSLVREDMDITLVERKEKCVSFLEMMISRIGMGRVQVMRADAGKIDIPQRFDLVTTKAAGRLSDAIPIVSGLMNDDGLYVTIKEAAWEWEVDGLDLRGMVLVSREDLPGKTGVLLAFGKEGWDDTR
ncbi:MAG: 16S rRNA (guanine(527)-N(7))-methyltransferase RsmG [Bacteroidales bacterium]|nr:16S rRNA (guanine(527)-N(7))-methyltransferase RsmG [Candidatus Latescibacterota bacterium]